MNAIQCIFDGGFNEIRLKLAYQPVLLYELIRNNIKNKVYS
jgi:hypothetical protein